MIKYHNPDSCNKCKGKNEIVNTEFVAGHMCEAETKCTECGFKDYWGAGHFESGQNMKSNCSTYSFENGRRVDYD